MCNLNRFSILSILSGTLLILPLTSCMTLGSTEGNPFTTTVKPEPIDAVCDVTPHTRGKRNHDGHAVYFLTRNWNPLAESYEIMCVADGYHESTITVKPGLSRYLWLNAVWLKGMPFAVAFDLATGIAWQYPVSVTIELEPTEAVTD